MECKVSKSSILLSLILKVLIQLWSKTWKRSQELTSIWRVLLTLTSSFQMFQEPCSLLTWVKCLRTSQQLPPSISPNLLCVCGITKPRARMQNALIRLSKRANSSGAWDKPTCCTTSPIRKIVSKLCSALSQRGVSRGIIRKKICIWIKGANTILRSINLLMNLEIIRVC